MLKYLKNLGDDNHTLKKLLESTNKFGEIALCKAYKENSQYSKDIVALLKNQEVEVDIKSLCYTVCNDKLKNHEDNLYSNVRTKRDIDHKNKEITHYYNNDDNTQGSISTISPLHSIDNHNTTTNQVSISNFNTGILILLRYFFPNQSASDTHYISPRTQHTIELDELTSKVHQALFDVPLIHQASLDEVVPGDN